MQSIAQPTASRTTYYVSHKTSNIMAVEKLLAKVYREQFTWPCTKANPERTVPHDVVAQGLLDL